MFDPVENHWWIAPASLVALFVVRAVIVATPQGKNFQGDTIYFLLFNLVWVPYAVYLTLWCYANPEKIATDPDGSTYDMRVFWPFFALFYVVFACFYAHRVMQRRAWWRSLNKATRLREQAQRLEAEGRIEEAETAYAQASWILHNKLEDRFSK